MSSQLRAPSSLAASSSAGGPVVGDGTFLTETRFGDAAAAAASAPPPPPPSSSLPEELRADQLGTTTAVQSTLLIGKRRVNDDVTDELQRMRQEFARRMKMCDDREAKIKKRQEKFLAQMEEYQTWISTNEKKEANFIRKAQDEYRVRMSKVTDVKTLLERLEELKVQRAALQERLARMNRYVAYLERVVASDDKYQRVDDLLARFQTLMDTRMFQNERSEELRERSDTVRAEMARMARDSQSRVLVLNSRAGELRDSIQRLHVSKRDAEDAVVRKVKQMRDMQQEVGALRLAIDNLSERCLDARRHTAAPITDAERLHVIRQRFDLLNFIIKEVVGKPYTAASRMVNREGL